MSSGTEKIVSNIKSEAQTKADSILQEAEIKVNSIIEDANKQAELEKTKILDDAKKQSDMRYQQIISEAKMNSRRMELEAREEVIEAAFEKASQELKDISSSTSTEYSNALIEMIKEAAIEIGGGDLIIQVKDEDKSKINNIDEITNEIKSATGKDTKLEIGESIETIGGTIIKTKNGEIEVNNTIEARMIRYKKALRSEVAKILFN
ncbi:V-type proton ATPase subunit E [Methanobrevibacter sp. TMH8]|uniref:V-type proton ATPase subunit E n=1 Tax=Methanobrevibacter sp. TMH8 TaxID=2848611 RepID=UPI001CCF0B11|nr:V-type proton ATPase subunit E [Methanobrevibacter sp. TMH8]MBZ9570356.1 V-type proton ATPase subunit E [Methanobrevibacter sp. TMH8]